jgi:predicted dehydrogenase
MTSKKLTKPSIVRLGIVGLGNVGSGHAHNILSGKIPGLELKGVCDLNPNRLAKYDTVQHFDDSDKMIKSGAIDAILISTPHFSHTTIGIAALQAGLHVLVEKPISVHKADGERLIAAYRKDKKQVFAAMFNQRTDSIYQKIHQLVHSGELGEIRRVSWTITDWFRTHAYYASGGWRATWSGEGGGVLLNQCPHNLDIYQWIFGVPDRVRGFCTLGRYHDIEVEDDVTAYFEYKSGTTCVFITSTGEAPGTNRLEIAGERGKLVMEKGKLDYTRNEIPMSEFSRTTTEIFAGPPFWNVEIPVVQRGEQHNGILKNFTNAILHGEKLIAPAEEGIHSIELANAILMSSMLGETVDIPLDGAKFEVMLKNLKAKSTYQKDSSREMLAADFDASLPK